MTDLKAEIDRQFRKGPAGLLARDSDLLTNQSKDKLYKCSLDDKYRWIAAIKQARRKYTRFEERSLKRQKIAMDKFVVRNPSATDEVRTVGQT